MEIKWNKVELKDKELFTKYYAAEQSRSCEVTFANNYLWEPHYKIRYTILNDMLVFKLGEEQITLSYPYGKSNIKETIELIQTYFQEEKKPFRMHLVTQEQFAVLDELFPKKYQIEYDRDVADYIYETEKLSTLAGKKLHAKRNHINRFKTEHPEWQYEAITELNKGECFQMAEKWCKINGCNDDPEKSKEFCVTLNALKHMEELNLVGGLIRIEEGIIAFSIGEPVSKDTFVVHIEKAFADIQGAYPIINQEFVLHEAKDYTYVNREEDTGAEGLRKAKLSYYPTFLQEKGLVTER